MTGQKDLSMMIPAPCPAELEARNEERNRDRRDRSARDLFNPTNLGHWIALCEAAGVKYVPAEEIARAPVDDLLRFDEKNAPATVPAFFSAVESAMAIRGDQWMVRWACCACAEVKYRLGTGNPEWHDDLVKLFHIMDLRAFDLVFDFPEETIAAYARPWIKATVLARYPVEYRVFVHNDQIDGISNYYPQRAIPNNAETLFDITRCYLQSVKLIKAQKRPLNCPPLDKHFDITKNHWTADFIRNEDGEILFLEGGPPHTTGGGAHPCCFPIGAIDGIAFAAGTEELDAMGLTAQTDEGLRGNQC